MKVEYKAVIRAEIKEHDSHHAQTGEVTKKEAYLKDMLFNETLVPCCRGMGAAIEDDNIVFDHGVCCNFNARWSEGEGDNLDINFCPFCGEKIILEEIKRVRMVNNPITIPAKRVDNFVAAAENPTEKLRVVTFGLLLS